MALTATAIVLVIALGRPRAAGALGRRARTAQDAAEIEAVTSGSQAAARHEPRRGRAARRGGVPALARRPQDPVRAPERVHRIAGIPRVSVGPRRHGRRLRCAPPDGRHAVVAVDDARLAVMDLETGALDTGSPTTTCPSMEDSQVVVSADGTTVAHLAFAPSPQDDCIAATQDDPMDRTTLFDAAARRRSARRSRRSTSPPVLPCCRGRSCRP